MSAQFSKKTLISKFVTGVVLASFILTNASIKQAYAAADKLRPEALTEDSSITSIKNDFMREMLGDYKVSTTVKFSFDTYSKNIIDLAHSSEAKKKMEELFGASVKDGEEYSVLYFIDEPVAFVKKDNSGVVIKKIGEDIEKIPLEALVEDTTKAKAEGIKAIDIILSDYLFLEKRATIAVADRMTLDYRELRLYHDQEFTNQNEVYKEKIKQLQQQNTPDAKNQLKILRGEYAVFLKNDGLRLAGGKGLSLAIMDDVVSVPPGFNVTTTAYFKFVKANPELYDLIKEELKVLDTMDDQKRDAITRKIREVMKRSSIPDDIKNEVLVMYRQLNVLRVLAKKDIPARVAVRSSGIKEDIKVSSWLPITTGSQAGQSDTFLNVSGEKNVLDKLKADWASLFTDRAVSYRDDAIFLIFSSAIEFEGKQPKRVYYDLINKLREYAVRLNKPEFTEYAETLTNYRNPGSVNLMNTMEEILKYENNPEIKHSLETMQKISLEFIHPEEIGIDVVIMQMVRSYLAGVIFSVNPATKMAGVSQALYKAWKGDKSLVQLDKEGNIVGTKPIVVSFEIAYGYGENVVGGKVDPDKFVMATYDGINWFFLERHKGTKLIQMINIEKSIDLLKSKLSQDKIRSLAGMVEKAISYDEVDKRINGILVTNLYGTRYLNELPDKIETEKDKKARVQKIATDIANMIKANSSIGAVQEYIKQNFRVSPNNEKNGLKESAVNKLIQEVFASVENASNEAKAGMNSLHEFFGNSIETSEAFILMIKEVWENKEFDLVHRGDVLKKLGLEAKEMRNLSYLIRALVDNSFTCNLETTPTHQNSFSINDEEAIEIAHMAWNIANFYKDQRDIEFAVEIDPSVTKGQEGRLEVYTVDVDGTRLKMEKDGKLVKVEGAPRGEKVVLKLYNVQARPYTAAIQKTDVVRQRSEVDEKFIEDNNIKAIASGTKGENATEAYVLVFDPNKTIDWHAETIRRLKAGQFSDEERGQIKKLGFNPDEFGIGKDKVLPIALYLLEADPNHDPIMRLVDAVITIRGGDTCHAAIFCREQGIPAVTGVGKFTLEDRLVATGDGLTVDANNGLLYKLEPDPKKRIPVNFVKFRIKPYGIPGDDDGMKYPTIGQIIASDSTAQQNSPIMLAEDDAGNSLTRAEFKAEQLGLNVFAGYGYDLIQNIKAGRMKMPDRVFVRDLIEGKVKGSEKFIARINNEIFEYFRDQPEVLKAFKEKFSSEYKVEDGIGLLDVFDVKWAKGKKLVVTIEDQRLLDYLAALPADVNSFLEYQYGLIQRRINFDYNIISQLENKPWILKEIENKLIEKGYSSFGEYVGKEFRTFYNLMGFTISPDKKAKNRAYDFAQDKIRGMPGSEIFSWPGNNPLVGLRGASLEIEGVDDDFDGNQKVLSFLLDSVIDANQNTHNQAWFYVFVRFARELDRLDTALERIAARKGKLPKQIGIMIEVPSDAILVEKLGKKLLAMREKYKKYGVELTFFSFGTNDYSHLAGLGDREDPRMKLKFLDPAAIKAIDAIKQAGYFYNDSIKKLPLIDEGADVMIQLMEAVVKEAKDLGIETSLCGEALTSLVGRGDYDSAGKIMNLLDSFGISMMSVRLLASMTRLDTMSATKEIIAPESDKEILFDLSAGEVKQRTGVIKGEVIYVEKAEDLLPDALKGLEGAELEEKREFLKLQSLESARSTMKTYNKVVVLNRNLAAISEDELVKAMTPAYFEQFKREGLLKPIGNNLYVWTNLNVHAKKFSAQLKDRRFSDDERTKIMAIWQRCWDNTIEGLERRGIDWDDLQYAKAIIVDGDVNLEGWDVFRRDKGIVPTRIKAIARGIGAMRPQLERQFVTIDYAAKKIYKGDLKVGKKKAIVRSLPIPQHDPQVDMKRAIEEDANNVYPKIELNPLILLAFEEEQIKGKTLENSLGNVFDEYVGKLIDELDKIAKEKYQDKKLSLIGEAQEKIKKEPEEIIKEFLQDRLDKITRDEGAVLSKNWLEDLRSRYFADMRKKITSRLNGKSAKEFIKDSFKQQMQEVIEKNKGQFVVHKTTSLNCLAFRNMNFGFLVEQVNPNPDYGLLGAARAISDFWEINRLELEAFKEVRAALPVGERKNFGLQITELKGTQSGAVIIAWKYILKDMGIIPGEDGLQLGVNIATPSDTLAVDKYFEYFKDFGTGLNFVTFDKLMLGAAWAGVDIYWDQWRRLAKKEELQEIGDVAIKIVKGKMEDINKNDDQNKKIIVSFAPLVKATEEIIDVAEKQKLEEKAVSDKN